MNIGLETPIPEGFDIPVRIDGISINPVDSKERLGLSHPLEERFVLGWNTCGEVISVGETVQNFKPGDMVMYAGDVTRPSSNAEFQLVDERIVGLKPSGLFCGEAASLPFLMSAEQALRLLLKHVHVPHNCC